MIDFELAAIASIRATFPGVVITGCFFHLCQALYRRLQQEGLQNAYAEEDGFLAIQARSFAALAFIPLQHVEDYYRALLASPNFDHRLDPFVEYFEVCLMYLLSLIGSSKALFSAYMDRNSCCPSNVPTCSVEHQRKNTR